MRHKLSLFCLLLGMATLFPFADACGRFRSRRAGGCPAPTASAAPCAGGCCTARAGGGCACCPECQCEDIDSCPCKAGLPACSSGCRCLTVRTSGPAVDPVEFPGIMDHAKPDAPKYRVNGREVSRQDVLDKLAQVPDDRKTLSLTFCGGTEEERKAAVDAAKNTGLDRSTLIHAYPADNPLVGDGFVTTGHPSVYLQTPNGKVLLRAEKADPFTLLAVADKVKGYDPSKDPTPGNEGLAFLPDLEKLLGNASPWQWAALAAIGYLWYSRNQQKQPPVA